VRAALETLSLKITASLTDAEVFLRKIPNDDPVSFVDFVVARIRSSEYRACDIILGTEKIGITVYFVECFGSYREFVSVATYTNQPAPNFSAFWQSEIEKLARSLFCQSIRFATVRHGLVSLALRNGWNVTEITLRKYLP
jgi:hypothetical protein